MHQHPVYINTLFKIMESVLTNKKTPETTMGYSIFIGVRSKHGRYVLFSRSEFILWNIYNRILPIENGLYYFTNNNSRLRTKWAVDTHLPSLISVQRDAQKNVTQIIGVCILAERKNGDLTIHCAFHATTVETCLKIWISISYLNLISLHILSQSTFSVRLWLQYFLV